MNATTTATTKRDRIIRAANGGGILANQILGCDYAAPVLDRKAEMIQGRLDRIAAGRTPHNTDAEYAQILSHQIGALADTMQYNHPDAAYYAQRNAVHAFRTGGLVAVIKLVRRMAAEARATAALLDN